MPLWLALVIGVLAWTAVSFLLACLVGRCLRGLDEPVNALHGSSYLALSGFIVDGARRASGGRT